jgi:hypothetical protein
LQQVACGSPTRRDHLFRVDLHTHTRKPSADLPPCRTGVVGEEADLLASPPEPSQGFFRAREQLVTQVDDPVEVKQKGVEPLRYHLKLLRNAYGLLVARIRKPQYFSREGLVSSDIASHDERQHSVGAIVGVDGLHICQVARDVVLEEHAVAPEDVPRVRHHLVGSLGVVHLGQGGHRDRHSPLCPELAQPEAERLHGGDVCEQIHCVLKNYESQMSFAPSKLEEIVQYISELDEDEVEVLTYTEWLDYVEQEVNND